VSSWRIRPASTSVLSAALLAVLGGCGGTSHPGTRPTPTARSTHAGAHAVARPVQAKRASPPIPSYPVLLAARVDQARVAFRPVVLLHGSVAAWLAQRAGVTLLRVDQHRLRLALHAGTIDPGESGWRYGDHVRGPELHHLVAAFNGGFRLNTGSGGFRAQGRTPVPLQDSIGSVVTYADGVTEIGAWQSGVPTVGRPVASVRQNLRLLIDGGMPAATLSSCALACWGATLGGGVAVPRSALGITGRGDLVYAAGVSLSPQLLADAMAGAGVQRAIELDINPQWVAGYLYGHHGTGTPVAVPLVPGQVGIAGHFLEPYSRDFFTVIAN
jgi:hypothetical protein